MKKIFLTFFILVSSMLLIFRVPSFKAIDNDYIYYQDYHIINFDNLNSKKLNDLLLGINGTLIEVEVTTNVFTKSYRFNTNMLNNLEKELTIKVIKDLEELGQRELAVTYKIQGFKINKMTIKCTIEELEKIKSRAIKE